MKVGNIVEITQRDGRRTRKRRGRVVDVTRYVFVVEFECQGWVFKTGPSYYRESYLLQDAAEIARVVG